MLLTDTMRGNIYFAFKRFLGSSLSKNLKFMRASQFQSSSENRIYQQKALVKLLLSSYYQVPYYRKAFGKIGLVTPRGEVNLNRFLDLPPMTKDMIRQHDSELLSMDSALRQRRMRMATGGTTGNPLVVYGDLEYWDWCLAQTWLNYDWIGLSMGMPYFYFWGAPQDLNEHQWSFKSKVWLETVQNRHVLNSRRLSEEIMALFLWKINHMPQHRHMIACVHELYDLACFSLDNQIPVTRPFSGISVTTAYLSEEMRETIQSVFHCPVYSRYGCREAGDMASECSAQDGLHVNPLYSYVEVVDQNGMPVAPGEEGRILVTNLHNQMMPLIRYEIQDTGILKEPGACSCGRHWDTLSHITGRLHERLELPDGSTFGKVFLHYAMEMFSDLRGYQLHHMSPTEVEVHLVSPMPNYLEVHAEEVRESYHRLIKCTHNLLKITYRQVAALEKTPSGKIMVIMKKFSQQEAPSHPSLPLEAL